MTDTIGGTRCKYCWRKPLGWGDRHHDEDCPDVLHLNRGNTPEAETAFMQKNGAEWEAGYAYGFEDNNIPYWKQNTDFYSRAFLLGYRVGKAEIDQAVEDAVQTNNNYGEWA